MCNLPALVLIYPNPNGTLTTVDRLLGCGRARQRHGHSHTRNDGTAGCGLGSAIGVAGGLFGTWMSLRSVPRGAQCSFLKKAAALGWAGVLGFTATTLLVPAPWIWLLWIGYVPLLLWFIRYVNHTLAALQASQSVDDPAA